MGISRERWAAARTTVAEGGERFARLLRASDATVMATADWSVADTGAHVASIAAMYTGLVRGGPLAGADTGVSTTTVDTVSDLNERVLAQFPERDTGVLADRLVADIDDVLRTTEHADPASTVPWLGDSRPPLCGVLAHLVNELHIHGRDIALATRRPWIVPPAEAALFFEVFFVELVRNGYGRLLDNDEPPRERRIAVEFRSAYTTPVTLVLHRGRVSVAEPGGPTDVRISFDPVVLNLMMFRRVGKARAALTGKVRVSGRRPWLLPTFLRTVRCP